MYSKIWEIVPSQGKALAILFLSFLVRTWLFFRIFLGQCGSAMLHRSGSFGVEAADTVRTILFVLFFLRFWVEAADTVRITFLVGGGGVEAADAVRTAPLKKCGSTIPTQP